ncbi:hypothetical protein LLH23_11315 [bacterium]|nr:hypothetical protein [bacterium]
MVRVANVKKVALVALVGKCSTAPQTNTHRELMDELVVAFREAAKKAPPVVEFIPVEKVVVDPVYRSLAATGVPPDAYSPVKGLTYVRQEGGGGLDCGPLVKSLGVDAVLELAVDFGVAVRQNAQEYYLTAEVKGGLVGPPEVLLWEPPPSFEEPIPAMGSFSHVLLHLAIGARWIVMTPPSSRQYAAVMQIAHQGGAKLPQQVATGLVEGIMKDVVRSRGSQPQEGG